MAGAGYKLFNTGDVLLASEVNTYLMQQTVMVFANATARTSALSGVLAEGMLSYLADTNATEVYDGSAWVSVSGTGDITAVTTGANSGLAGGVTTGNADIKINFASKGQLAVGTGSGTTDFLNVGTNNQVLTADSSTSTGLKWAAASSGGFIFITSSTFSNVASVTIDNCFTSTYDTYLVTFTDIYATTHTDDPQLQFRYSGTTQSTLYWGSWFYYNGGAFVTGEFNNAAQMTLADYIGNSTNPTQGQIFLSPGGTSGRPVCRGQYGGADSEGVNNFGGMVISTQTFDGLLFKSSSTNVTGTIRVYGMVKS